MEYNCAVDTRSFYIHWPFCPYRCHFCPFVAISGQDHLMGQYHKALMKEIITFAQKTAPLGPLETIYLGGGTPSTWPNELLLDMFGILRDTFDLSKISEITLEANPGTVQKEQLAVWKEAGITRLSIGVQSLDDEVLKKLNRHQKVSDVYQLINWAQHEFDALSVDLIIGLPGVEEAQWKSMIHEVVQWPVNHISMYFLSIHENTPLYTRLVKNELTLPPEDPIVDLYYWTVEAFAKAGLEQYEISSFARKGFQAKHNQVYWERKPYKGFGIGSCSFDGQRRLQNIKNVMQYMKLLEEGKDIGASSELLTPEQIRLEKVMLGLRRMKGLVISDVLYDMTDQEKNRFMHNIKEFEAEGLVKQSGDILYLNKSVVAVENEVALRLLQ